jgi:hypothetical protein
MVHDFAIPYLRIKSTVRYFTNSTLSRAMSGLRLARFACLFHQSKAFSGVSMSGEFAQPIEHSAAHIPLSAGRINAILPQNGQDFRCLSSVVVMAALLPYG